MGTRAIRKTDYYPFGAVAKQWNNPDQTQQEKYRHGYQGEYSEADSTTGWNAFELRMYDPIIGRWLQVDPERQHASPYLSMGNNPLTRTDPDGGTDYDWYRGEDGEAYFFKGVHAENVEIDGQNFERLGAFKYIPYGFGGDMHEKFGDSPFLLGYADRIGESFGSWTDQLFVQREGVIVLSTDMFSRPFEEWDNPSSLKHVSTIVDLKTKMDFSNVFEKAKFLAKALEVWDIGASNNMFAPFPRVTNEEYDDLNRLNSYKVILNPTGDSVLNASRIGPNWSYHWRINGISQKANQSDAKNIFK